MASNSMSNALQRLLFKIQPKCGDAKLTNHRPNHADRSENTQPTMLDVGRLYGSIRPANFGPEKIIQYSEEVGTVVLSSWKGR